MRVAFVLGTTSGGTGRHVMMLAEGLLRRGHQVLVVGPRSVEEQFGFRAAGAVFVPVQVSDRPHPVNDVRAVARIRRCLKEADVAHAHGLRAGALAALAGGRTPLVVTLHNALTAGGLVGAVYAVLERVVARGADRVLTVSPDLGDRMRALGARDVRAAVVPAPPLRAATRPVPEVLEELGAAGRPVVLTIARLAQQKGLDTLLDVAAECAPGDAGGTGGGGDGDTAGGAPGEGDTGGVAGGGADTSGDVRGEGDTGGVAGRDAGTRGEARGQDDTEGDAGGEGGAGGDREGEGRSGDFGGAGRRGSRGSVSIGQPLFLVAGEGPLRAALQARIDAERLPVRLLGNRDDIPDLLAAATLVVWPSRWEGQPLSLSEALMAGKPVVATAVGGIPELMGDAGVLVPYGDVDAMRAAVRELIDDPAERRRRAQAAARRGAELPDAADAVEAVLAAYPAPTGGGKK
ncbi:glycosyltransferase family 4 protein [Nonomuraea roseola]|uniref:Glycosyltransferase family 4 protein n=1 Tax=Nonomuraea roseola TaxID=46179 RepID=A0ABV5QCQ2_9ACTN